MQISRLSISLSVLLAFAMGGDALAQNSLPTDPTGRLNPENLGRVCDNKISRYLAMIESQYRLTPEQITKVRTRLEELKQDQIRYSLSVAAERAMLHEQAMSVRPALIAHAKAASQPVDPLALTRQDPSTVRLEAIKAGEPLFNLDRVLQEVDRLLPAEQAKAGHRNVIAAQQTDKREMAVGFEREMLGIGEGSVHFLRERVRGAWAFYVQRFCAKFRLSDDQRATAESILRDVEARRDAYLADHQAEMDALMAYAEARADGVPKNAGPELQVDRFALFAPVERLWAELRARLDAIPTVVQVNQAREGLPAWPATRPSDYVSGVRLSTTRPATSPTR